MGDRYDFKKSIKDTLNIPRENMVISSPELLSRSIVLTDLENKGNRYKCKVKDKAVVGRSRSADICITTDVGLSRHHCRFYFLNDDLYVHDMGSVNHTVINGYILTKDDHDINVQDGDLLILGNTKLQINIEN